MTINWLNHPGWGIFLLLVPCVVAGVYYISRKGIEKLPARRNGLLIGLRSMLILSSILILFQPVIEEDREIGLSKLVNIYMDRSESMVNSNFFDAFREKHRRLADELGSQINFQLFSVSGNIDYIAGVEEIDSLKSKGQHRTRAVQDVAEMINISNLQTTVITTDDPSVYLQALRSRTEDEGKIYFVTPEIDDLVNIGIMQVDYHRYMRLGDHLPIRVHIYSTKSLEEDFRIEFYNVSNNGSYESGKLIAGRDIRAAKENFISVAFDYRSLSAGRKQFEVRLICDYDDIEIDNKYRFNVEVIADSIKVLYLEGYPRWEYQHLRKLFEKDDSLLLMDYLVQDDPYGTLSTIKPGKFISSGFDKYDVVLVGDINPEGQYLSTDGKESLWVGLVEYVKSGGGLVFIPGKRYSRQLYNEKLIDKLLPVEFHPDSYGAEAPIQYVPVITRGGELSRLFRRRIYEDDIAILGNREETDKGFPAIPWIYDSAASKKSAMTLMEARAVKTGDESERDSVLVNYHNYGKGLVVYVGTDMLWRFKIISDGNAYKNLWSNVLRFVASSAIESGSSNIVIKTDKSVYRPGDVVHLFVHSAGEVKQDELTVSSYREDDKNALNMLKLSQNFYYSSFIAAEPGEYHIGISGIIKTVRVDNSARGILKSFVGRKRGEDIELPDGIEQVGLSDYESLIKGLSMSPDVIRTTTSRVDLWNNWYIFTGLVFIYTIELILRRRFSLI